MHYETFRDHKYLGAWQFMEGDRTLTIDRVVQGMIEREDGQPPERVPLVYFRELDLPLVLNATNGKMIYMMYGTPDVRQWSGKRVTLTAALTTDTSGNTVMGIRVHPRRPEEVVVEETPDAKAARLEAELAALRRNAQGAVAERAGLPSPAPAPVPPASAPVAEEVAHAAS